MMMGQYEVNRSQMSHMMGCLQDMGRLMKEDFMLRHPDRHIDTPFLDVEYSRGEAEEKMDQMKVELVENSGDRGKGFGGRSLAHAARKKAAQITDSPDADTDIPVNQDSVAGPSRTGSEPLFLPDDLPRTSSSSSVNPSRATEIFRTTGFARPIDEGGAAGEGGQAPGKFWLPTIDEAE
jgi:hypothetical protein